jgi:hypothetical protein
MLQTIRAAGFKPVPDDVRFTVTGIAEKRGDALIIRLDRMKTPVELTAIPHSSSPETAPHLTRHLGDRVQVEGYWSPGTPANLAVTAMKVEGEPEGVHRD